MKNKTCIVIVGPTAVGKTSLAIQLATSLGTEILSADSRQCYRELNIGVAKPSPQQLQQVKHYFINSHSIRDEVNAASFEQYAVASLDLIFMRFDVAVMVGGTGLYIDAVCKGMDDIPAIPPATRSFIMDGYRLYGLGWLQQQLLEHDPGYMENADIHNPQRLMRSLEVKLSTGRSIRSYHSGLGKARDFSIIKIGLELPREELYRNVNERVDHMVGAGLVEEAAALLPERNLNALNTVGYKEVFQYLDGHITREEAITAIKQNTRRYAKRQLTWFKNDQLTRWFIPADYLDVEHYIKEVVS